MKVAMMGLVLVGLTMTGCGETFSDSRTTFSQEYRLKSHDSVVFENPELYELVNIAIYLSGYDQSQHQRLFEKSAYARSVSNYFKKYLGHPCILAFKKNVQTINDNYAVRDTAYEYTLTSSGKIDKTGFHSGIVGYRKELFPSLIKNLESFAKDTKYQDFYRKNQPFFTKVQKISKSLMDVAGAKQWLEARYPIRINSYRVICSPLTGGNHRTHRGQEENFKEILMFVSAPSIKNTYFQIDQIQTMRIVFTEINHNYVNPTTDSMKNQLEFSLFPLSKWSSGGSDSKNYKGAYGAFNEYMTWSLFSLYVLDRFPEKMVKPFLVAMENQMVSRGFVRFKEFNTETIRFGRENPTFTGGTLQSHMLKWCKRH